MYDVYKYRGQVTLCCTWPNWAYRWIFLRIDGPPAELRARGLCALQSSLGGKAEQLLRRVANLKLERYSNTEKHWTLFFLSSSIMIPKLVHMSTRSQLPTSMVRFDIDISNTSTADRMKSPHSISAPTITNYYHIHVHSLSFFCAQTEYVISQLTWTSLRNTVRF